MWVRSSFAALWSILSARAVPAMDTVLLLWETLFPTDLGHSAHVSTHAHMHCEGMGTLISQIARCGASLCLHKMKAMQPHACCCSRAPDAHT